MVAPDAGLAIEAYDQGVDVLIMIKGTIGNSGCTVNVGTSAAVGPWGDPEDTHLSSMRDLLAHGGFLGNQDLVKVLAEESSDRILELQDWGIDFEREPDGASGLDYVNNELVVFKAKSTILATGYRPWSVFTNAKGEEFLHRHGIHSLDGVDKEALCRGVWQEIKDGGETERDTIFIDLRPAAANGEEVPESWLEHLRTLGTVYFGFGDGVGFDPLEGPVETAPLAHTTTGGVRINSKCESTVPGLYAAGAVAGGVYGHARPEGYTSMITLVFGRRAGPYGAEAAKAIDAVALDEAAVRPRAFDPAAMKKRVQTIMKKYGWVIKDETGLKQGLRELADVGEAMRASEGPSGGEVPPLDEEARVKAIEVPNLLLCSQLMLRGALERQDSRGAFFRDEYPDADDENWLKNIIYRQVDSELSLTTEPVDLRYVRPEPQAVEAGR